MGEGSVGKRPGQYAAVAWDCSPARWPRAHTRCAFYRPKLEPCHLMIYKIKLVFNAAISFPALFLLCTDKRLKFNQHSLSAAHSDRLTFFIIGISGSVSRRWFFYGGLRDANYKALCLSESETDDIKDGVSRTYFLNFQWGGPRPHVIHTM